ncbi:MAG: Do family serine endopeptidase [Opitutaceae bacterium]|nr:Do family serine endopeptidase [Opitutaceae bacterium]
MNSRTSASAFLFACVFAATVAVTAGLTAWAADAKPGKANKARKAPAADSTATAADGTRASLQIAVDARPIDRDAAERVSYARIVQRTAASVVYVYSTKTVRAPDMSSFFNDPMFRRFFNLPEDELDPDAAPAPRNRGNNNRKNAPPRNNPGNRAPDRQQQGLGSGVVITADGYILTNNHVIEGADDVRVSVGDSNKRYEAKVVGRDPGSDLAVLKIEATGLSPVTFGDSDQALVGDVVLAIGNPFGVGQSVSRGIVSALSRGMGMGVFEDFIQTDAAINPGNSGGALLDSDGRLIGINSAILSRSGGFAGVGFAIPSNLVRSVAEQLARTGRVERGLLGVRPQPLDEALTAQFGTEKGALLSEVTEDSPADKAGLKPGDVITKVNATEIRDPRHLTLTVSKHAPGTEVTIEYLREGKTKTASVTLARRDDAAVARDDAPLPKKDEGILNGVGVGPITPELRSQLGLPARMGGVVVTAIDPDTPAAKQGLREGDVILEIDRKPLTDVDQAVKLSEEIKGPKFLLRIWRNGSPTFLAIDESK